MSLRLASLGVLLGFVAACSSAGPATEPASMTTTTAQNSPDAAAWAVMPAVARRDPPPRPVPEVALAASAPEEEAAILPAITGDGKLILTHTALLDVARDVAIKRFEEPDAVAAWRAKDLAWEVLDHIQPVAGAATGNGDYERVSTVGNLLIGFVEPTLRFGDATSREVLSSKKVVWWMAADPEPWPSPPGVPAAERFSCPRPTGAMQDAFITKDRRLLLVEIHYMQPVCVCGEGGQAFHVTKLSAANIALAKASGPLPPAAL